MAMDIIDETDAAILELLQENGTMTRKAIAEKVGWSLPTVSTRISKLEEKGVIAGYHAVLDDRILRFDTTAFVQVVVEGSSNRRAFQRRAQGIEEVLEVHSTTGDGSHMMKVRTYSTSALERLLARLQSWPGVQGTSTSIVLRTVKETRSLPVRAAAIEECYTTESDD